LPVVNASKQLIDIQFAEGIVQQSGRSEFIVRGIQITPTVTRLSYILKGKVAGSGIRLMDEQGLIMEEFSSRCRSETGKPAQCTTDYAPVDAGMEHVYAVPYSREHRQDEAERMTAALSGQYPIILAQGTEGEMTVHRIEFQEDHTFIYYELTGTNPYSQRSTIWLEDSEGNRLTNDKGTRTRTDAGAYTFVLEYPPLDPAAAYALGMFRLEEVRLQEELTARIPLR
jgi:hypothetical protein